MRSYHTDEDKKEIVEHVMRQTKNRYKQISKRIVIYFLMQNIDTSFLFQKSITDELIYRALNYGDRRDLCSHPDLTLDIIKQHSPNFAKDSRWDKVLKQSKLKLTQRDFEENRCLFEYPNLWNKNITYNFILENENEMNIPHISINDEFYTKAIQYELARKYAFDNDIHNDLYKYSVESGKKPCIIRDEFKLVSAYVGDYMKRHLIKERLKLIPRNN